MPDETENDYEEAGGARSFWSGTIAFGLVSLPVSLYTANRSSRASLRMLDEDGTPLARRYFCTREDKPLSRDDLVRGYEIEPEKFVEIADEELESLAPKQSREIDLRRFVPLDEVDPMFFERAYFLIPNEGAIKAYRLLAQSMESMGRAGIATVVMRGKEYLIAIIAERGILRAETLRFYDELRTPADVGLPQVDKAPAILLNAISEQIDKLTTDKLDESELMDQPTRRLLELVERKLDAGEDVVRAPEVSESEPETAEIIDLMEILKQSLQGRDATTAARTEQNAEPKHQPKEESRAPARKATAKSGSRRTKSGNGRKDKAGTKAKTSHRKHGTKTMAKIDSSMTKAELYEQAKAMDIPGRSHMSRDELMQVIQLAH